MQIIEIKQLDNGAHANQTIHGVNPSTFPVPQGWAIVPDDMDVPASFPFVDIEVSQDEESGYMYVTGMTAREVPEPEPEPEPEPSELEQLRADVDYIAMETGVEL